VGIRSQLYKVPFEAISKLYYFGRLSEVNWKVPPPDVWLMNVTTRNVGGNCFSINFNLCQLLSQLGFQARLMRANGGNHIMVGVKLDGRLYLSDAAHGGPLFKAVDLAATTRAEEFGRGVHIYPMVDEPGAYHFDQYAGGEHRIFVCPRTLPYEVYELLPLPGTASAPSGSKQQQVYYSPA
jgi:arylamine N-acetyltransferase